MMSARKLRVPVTCPDCGAERLAELPADRVTGALREGRPLRLHAPCHDIWWNASKVETDQVRQYIGALSLPEEHGRPPVQGLEALQC
ncbi:MAG: hypothetical protein M3N97_08265 [Pseudomonadota bacterium]|nr:hypothetical protein [Pseudomonadota bacterium]